VGEQDNAGLGQTTNLRPVHVSAVLREAPQVAPLSPRERREHRKMTKLGDMPIAMWPREMRSGKYRERFKIT
jgi:hypothetical protein